MKRFLETLMAVVLCIVALMLAMAGWDFAPGKSPRPATQPEAAKR